jgi:drug/metabolite transporter (DMT)-like permease
MTRDVQAIGIALAVIGAVLVAIAYMRGRGAGAGIVPEGTDLAHAKPPPRRAQSLMAFGLGLLIAGVVLAIVSNV